MREPHWKMRARIHHGHALQSGVGTERASELVHPAGAAAESKARAHTYTRTHTRVRAYTHARTRERAKPRIAHTFVPNLPPL